ncbi:class II aldolase/adducin family protein [Fictibacillus phosphorivorans]|uniref:class II aldolase/adducin family protein n=1 Tax=Fictibacillus phosphorivorans TaxID=1221500 RepID=UPI00203B3DD7|nr:class II aldolase/adducin family protein [Fictibacillus phosphorivorans]MCM3717781.1 class II aldolase/adducin family protein [Fictibacillus phosphorivorans]MCM3777009.1 class II aldolase/adducin family protein [Fictibacillus phosphorivorans]
MIVETNQVRGQLQQVGRYMMGNNLAWGTAGNISARTSEESLLITASGTYLGELAEHDFVECTFDKSEGYKRKPSKELPMHRAIYEERPDISAVLHASPFYSTLVACSNLEVKNDLFIESMYYLERVERVAYHHPGSNNLAEAVRKKAKSANVLLLENHGVLVFDTNIKEAIMALETLEMACKMHIKVNHDKIRLQPLSNKTIDDFLHYAGYKPRREWGEK